MVASLPPLRSGWCRFASCGPTRTRYSHRYAAGGGVRYQKYHSLIESIEDQQEQTKNVIISPSKKNIQYFSIQRKNFSWVEIADTSAPPYSHRDDKLLKHTSRYRSLISFAHAVGSRSRRRYASDRGGGGGGREGWKSKQTTMAFGNQVAPASECKHMMLKHHSVWNKNIYFEMINILIYTYIDFPIFILCFITRTMLGY